MEFLNRNFSQDWQHLRESDGGADLSGIEQGNRRSRVLTSEMLSDRSSSDLISQRYNHPTNRIVRYPSRSPKNFTTAVPCQQPLCRLIPKSFDFSHPYRLVPLENSPFPARRNYNLYHLCLFNARATFKFPSQKFCNHRTLKKLQFAPSSFFFNV